jgi:hypothetical protein
MDSNTHSGSRPARLAALAAAVDELAAQDLVGQTDAVLADQVLELRRLLDRLEGHWLQTLAAVDGRGAAGADQGLQVGSTAAWLRGRLRLGAGAAAGWVRTARALYRGPLTQTGQALAAGELSTAHARCGPRHPRPAGPGRRRGRTVLVAAARRLDLPGCAGSWVICGGSPTPRAPRAGPSGSISGGPVAVAHHRGHGRR